MSVCVVFAGEVVRCNSRPVYEGACERETDGPRLSANPTLPEVEPGELRPEQDLEKFYFYFKRVRVPRTMFSSSAWKNNTTSTATVKGTLSSNYEFVRNKNKIWYRRNRVLNLKYVQRPSTS